MGGERETSTRWDSVVEVGLIFCIIPYTNEEEDTCVISGGGGYMCHMRRRRIHVSYEEEDGTFLKSDVHLSSVPILVLV